MLNSFPARIAKRRDGSRELVMVNFPKVSIPLEGVDLGVHVRMILPHLLDAIYAEIVRTKAFPIASLPKRGQTLVHIPANSFIKLQLHLLLQRRGLSHQQLATLLDRDSKQIARLLDVNYATRMTELDYAVGQLGGVIGVIVEDQAVLGS